MNNFSNLGLSAQTISSLDLLGFEKPTLVQEQAIPLLLQNDPCDFIGLAQTGSGKTAAFSLPLIELINEDLPATQALVMAPTRELGQQTAKQIGDFTKNHKDLNVEVVYGGAAITNQIKALRSPTQIIVATPGRLLDLIKRKSVKLDKINYVVLDEADEMLNMGFKEAIDEILSYTPEEKSTWLFSATMPSEIRRIVKKYMSDPKEISVNPQEKSNRDIAHKFVMTKTANKIPALRRFLDLQPDMRGIMFCRTRRETQEIAKELGKLGYNADALHGELSQPQRDQVMSRFKSRSMQLLVATDVAARGIDVDDLTHVIHHTLPDQLESYTHRSGRTGRAGKKGISLVFINPREGRKIKELEKKIQVKFEHIDVPGSEAILEHRIQTWAEEISSASAHKEADQVYESLEGHFASISKEDLLKKLISIQLNTLSNEQGVDLNETAGGSPEKRDRTSFHRYFVNVGSVDGMSKSDVISFLSEISGIGRKYFGEMTMKKNHTYFDVDSRKDGGLAPKFKGVSLEGKAIRLNRDDDPVNREFKKSKKRSGRKPPKKSHRKGGRRRR